MEATGAQHAATALETGPAGSGPGPGGEPRLVEMRRIAKRFGKTQALRGVDFEVRPGEVHALVGENGAGKSTLIKVLAGIHRLDEGSVRIDGEDIAPRNPAHARKLGLSFVFQELAPLPHFDVAEYMNLGQPYERRMGVLIDWKALHRRAREVSDRIGFDLPLREPMYSLSIAQQRMAEIAQGLIHSSRLVVMDEPTATLSDREVEKLFEIIRRLRENGVAVMYVSHRLEEIFELADRVTVFRDGTRIAEHPIAEVTRQQLVAEITGAASKGGLVTGVRASEVGKVKLETRGLTTSAVTDVSLELRGGEVVGLAGLVGSGRSEVARAIYGADRLRSGEVRVKGEPVAVGSPRRAIEHGIGYLPEERKTQALLGEMSIRENLTIGALGRYARPSWGLVSKRRERAATIRFGTELRLRFGGPEAPITSLSGGNQQKVVLARLLDTGADVLLLDEPTKGVDIGAKQEMFRLIRELSAKGSAIMFISSDLEELCEVCDRAYVMREGHIVGELSADALTKSAVLELSYGRKETP